MVKEICKDVFVLSQNCTDADKNDMQVVKDLTDTITAHADDCVGIAANMIGITKRIIVVQLGKEYVAMINPVIVDKSKQVYNASEGCLCHMGEREAKRYSSITVEYKDKKFKKKKQSFSGFPAQIIQHEIDHCNGIIV